jgi:hypothetical protein
MANDRIYISCKFCPERKLLAKHWAHVVEIVDGRGEIEDFLTDHLIKHRGVLNDLAGDPGFTLVTESQPK